MPSTSQMLLLWDQQRARSQQKAIGWSEIGGCRRRAGYRLAGTEPSNPSGSVQAILGTAIDGAVNEVAVALGLVNQQEITFGRITGHFDRIEDGEVVDVKSVGTDRWLEHIELHGPSRQNRWQIQAYCAGCLMAGLKVNRVRVDFIARDTGREYQWRDVFRPLEVKAAMEWVKQVREADLGMLPRDYEPDSSWCLGCPFGPPDGPCWEGAMPERDPRSVIYTENPDAAKWADELWETRQEIKRLQEVETRLKGVLDAVRPDQRELVAAGRHLLDFRPTAKGHGIYFKAPSAIKKGLKT